MDLNKVGSEHMVHYAVKKFVGEAATWWRMHQAINESNKKIAWKELTKILLGSCLVTPMQRTVNYKRPRACKICGGEGLDTPTKDTKMDVPIVRKVTWVRNVPLLKSHVLCVKERIITPLSVNF